MKVPTDLPVLGKLDLVVDNTLLSSAICSTQLAMRHVLHLTSKVDAAELTCGSALHEGLARWLVKGGDTEIALKRFDKVYHPWADANVPKVDEKGKPSRLRWEPVHRIFEHWLKTHPLEKWQFSVDPAHVEIPVWAPLGYISEKGNLREGVAAAGTPVIYMLGLLDAIGRKKTGGGTWSIDHKTTSNLGPWYRERQEDSAQFTGQLWAAEQRGLILNGAFLNGIELPNLNSSDSTCREHGVAYKRCALQHVKTMLFPVTRTRHELVAWEKTARGLAGKFLKLKAGVRDIHDVREVPMEGRFAGLCGRCTFRQFCREGRQAHQEGTFIKSPWSPLDHAQRRGGLRDKAA
jgi:PD-(D/E)XK nuclease superfamily